MNEVVNTILANTALLLVVAILTESVTEVIKSLAPKVIKDKVTYAISIIVGITLAFSFELNLFGLEGYGGYVSIVFAGLIASRGANYVHDFLKKFDILK